MTSEGDCFWYSRADSALSGRGLFLGRLGELLEPDAACSFAYSISCLCEHAGHERRADRPSTLITDP